MTDDPAKLLVEAGEALFGGEWQRAFAEAFGVNERTVRRIVQAVREGRGYPVSPGLLTEVATRLSEKADANRLISERIRALAQAQAIQ